jgi:DnaJ-class molecular chaperone
VTDLILGFGVVALFLGGAAAAGAARSRTRSHPATTRECLRCNGSGRAVRYPLGRARCPLCGGRGRLARNEGAWL